MRTAIGAAVAVVLVLCGIGWLMLRGLSGGAEPNQRAAPATAKVGSEPTEAPHEVPLPVAERDALPTRPEVEEGAESSSPLEDERGDEEELRSVLLHVVDSADGEPIQDVEIFAATDSRSISPLEVGDSPLEILPGEHGIERFWVQAPGYSRAWIAFDFGAGGERQIALEAAGELRVFVDAAPGDAELTLETRETGRAREQFERQVELAVEYAERMGRKPSGWTRRRLAALERLAPSADPSPSEQRAADVVIAAADRRVPAPRGEWVLLEHVAPGEWLVGVTDGEHRERQLGFTFATVRAGARTECVVEVGEPTPPRLADVSGTVTLASVWSTLAETQRPGILELTRVEGTMGMQTTLSRRKVDQFDALGAGSFRWNEVGLLPGTYSLGLPNFSFVSEFTLEDRGTTEVHFVVPPPCSVDLLVTDRASGEPMDVREIEVWVGDGDVGRSAKRVRTEDAGQFRFRAPRGSLHVRLDFFGQDYFIVERAFALRDDHHALTFAVAKAGRVRLNLWDGEARVPWDDSFFVRATPLAEDGQLALGELADLGGLVGWEQLGGRDVRHVLSPAGRFAIVVEAIPGFLPSAPREVDVGGGEIVDLDVPLVRDGG